MQSIRVINPDFELLAELYGYTSAIISREWHGIGSLDIEINKNIQGSELLEKGNILILGANIDEPFIIKHRQIKLDQDGKKSEVWSIKAPSLKSILEQRITVPPDGLSYDRINSDAETVIKHYTTNNVITPADSNRIMPLVEVDTNQNRGTSIEWRSRYKNLANELNDISFATGINWNISLDIQNQKFVLDVREGKDLTASQSVNPPVIISPEFASVKELEYLESMLDFKNYAYIAGQGVGADRRVISQGTATGLERYEVFVDARDVAEVDDNENPRPEGEIIAELEARGQRNLEEFEQETYLNGQILMKSPFEYRKDYNLGDIVTLQNKDWGVTLDARITKIKESYDANGMNIEAVFGNDQPDLISKIKNAFGELSNEVRK